MNVSVIIPCHNEADSIVSLLSELVKVLQGNNVDGEVIVVDDNSTDETSKEVRREAEVHERIKLVQRRDGKCGVGRTLRAGFDQARGDVIVTMDGDFSHDPADIPRFLHEIRAGADLVIGSRYGKAGEAHMPSSRKLISGGYSRLARILFHTNITDLTSGYRAIRKDALNRLHLSSSGFAIHAEIHLKALNTQLSVTEIPILYHRRLGGTSKLSYFKVGIPYVKVLVKELSNKLRGKALH